MNVVTEDTKRPAKSDKRKKGSFWRELPVLVIAALLMALTIKTFLVQAFYIPSGSMENTLLLNDRVLVNKLVYHTRDVERGDVIVFSGVDSWKGEVDVPPPSNVAESVLRWIGTAFGVTPGEKDYIKRVIGVGGDTVKCCDDKGRVTVNGVPLEEESYLYPGNAPSDKTFEVKVQPGRLWVMGDHREISYDSRSHQGDKGDGAIPVDTVVGRAFIIVWPFSRLTTIPIPDTFAQPALSAVAALGGATPLVGGFACAMPLMWWRRRLLAKPYHDRRSGLAAPVRDL
nr:signal peptidase I [Sphaerisporangium krabiense]